MNWVCAMGEDMKRFLLPPPHYCCSSCADGAPIVCTRASYVQPLSLAIAMSVALGNLMEPEHL
jgi:hypothetical protein